MAKVDSRSEGAWKAVVLAGERGEPTELTKRFGTRFKALIPVGGIPMLKRVLTALERSKAVEGIYLCAPEEADFSAVEAVGRLRAEGLLQRVPAESRPSLSAYRALSEAGGKGPVLVTTADHALLTAEMVDYFCSRVRPDRYDLAVALARLGLVKDVYPEVKRTAYRFCDGSYCTCNLFGFLNERAYSAAEFWRQVEDRRKSPLKVVGSFGWFWAVKYLSGRLSLEQGLERGSKLLGCRVGAIMMPFAEAAIDVDTLKDWSLADSLCQKTQSPGR